MVINTQLHSLALAVLFQDSTLCSADAKRQNAPIQSSKAEDADGEGLDALEALMFEGHSEGFC